MQEIKAMLDTQSGWPYGSDVDKLLAFARAALPVIEAAKEQSSLSCSDAWDDYTRAYRRSTTITEQAATTFTESYPDAPAS
jgi:hypothetical protein